MDNNTTNNQEPKNEQTPSVPKYISQRTLLLIFILGAVTLFFLYLAIRPQWKNQPTSQMVVKPTPTPTPYAESLLSLVPAQLTGTPGVGTLTYNVNINSNINTVNAVQLELAFDPKVLSNITVTPGPFFAKPVELIKNIDYKLGRISYAVGIQPTDFGVRGNGTVAIISFQYQPSSSMTTITFLPKTLVAAEGVTQSVLKAAQPVTIPLNGQ